MYIISNNTTTLWIIAVELAILTPRSSIMCLKMNESPLLFSAEYPTMLIKKKMRAQQQRTYEDTQKKKKIINNETSLDILNTYAKTSISSLKI